ncbi:MAG: hypothetical protein NC543_14230 [bacterium]|nr:hypothetical protein [bacterium]MCM1376222.1 hypothetical protein [Muribaculum sp.]
MNKRERMIKGMELGVIGIMLVFLTVANLFLSEPRPLGEWDDFALVTVSLLHDGNFTVSQEDIIYAREVLPEWNCYLDSYRLSGYFAGNGDELSWYFPSYSLLCLPIMWGLRLLHFSGTNTFVIVNILLFISALLVICFHSTFQEITKLGLIMALCANPVIIYTCWTSGEIFIFSFLIMALVHWERKEYGRTAIFLSVASTLNPTVLAAGLIVILEFMIGEIRKRGIRDILRRPGYILLVACCWLPCFLPFVWNLCYVGHINMTAATEMNVELRRVVGRFWAYLWDLNLGFLPYYGLFFLAFWIILVMGVIQKKWHICAMGAAFLAVVMSYSLEVHINSGMSGLARYSAWSGTIMLMMVFAYFDRFRGQTLRNITALGTIAAVAGNGGMVLMIMASNPIGYLEMTPLAAWTLDHVPALYNPLPDIFNARTNHLDQVVYEQNLPIVYCNGQNEIRKILLRPEYCDRVLEMVTCDGEVYEWLEEELAVIKTGGRERYLSVTDRYPMYYRSSGNETGSSQ